MVSVIVPLFNEEEVVGQSYAKIKAVAETFGEPYEMIMVNDGSRDGTSEKLREIAAKDENVKIINFSRNFGHQIAVTAGIDHASGDAAIIIDADLQDPPEVMTQMLTKWREGFLVVYGKRIKREGESFFKKTTAAAFYRFLNSMTEVKFPNDAGDFRLIDKKVIEVMKNLPEHNRYLRGLVAWAGFKQTFVEFKRLPRTVGESKYPLRKMLRLAFDGITAFSDKPLKLTGVLGVIVCLSGIITAIWQAVSSIFCGNFSETACWAALIIFIQGLIMICMNIQGAYISRMYDESKNRPLYIVKEKLNF